MSSSDSTAGINAIVLSLLVACVAMTQLDGTYIHWFLIIPGTIVGLWAVQKIG